MLLERTIAQLNVGGVPLEQARALAELGYLQWLEALPSSSDYRAEAMRAYEAAAPFARVAPAVDAFRDLLVSSTGAPLAPLPIAAMQPRRRGGARSRREA